MMEVVPQPGNVLEVRLQGVVHGRDYAALRRQMDALVGRAHHANLVVELDGVKAVTPGAAWQDVRMARQVRHLDRVALVGRGWWRAAAWALKPFVGHARHFPSAKRTEALLWARDPPPR